MEAWKIVGLVIAALASVTGMLGALYGIVTVPVLRTLKAEISASESRLKIALVEMDSRMDKRLIELDNRIDKRLTEMEARLNQRIDTRLVHR